MNTTTPSYTSEEMREMVYRHMARLCDYWSSESYGKTEKERMHALCFSILAMMDGCTHLPAMTLFPRPNSSDKEYRISLREKWWDENMPIITSHEDWYPFLRREKLPDIV